MFAVQTTGFLSPAELIRLLHTMLWAATHLILSAFSIAARLVFTVFLFPAASVVAQTT
jgi:hypothetical protein